MSEKSDSRLELRHPPEGCVTATRAWPKGYGHVTGGSEVFLRENAVHVEVVRDCVDE